ncbi:unnamed protein product [Onchocerca flexuosa]|uniref:WAP domain-containing protein n=1 Tax=Onchocerca flexuosa TaxID=387005 RepID=A0A183I4T6_9BILA|nr:unnamed protein product [Onchocerca flexuosa]
MINCTVKGGANACYTCMGRDMENCETGTVCCSGSCFKLIDEKHDLIMKGCTNEDQEDGSMKRKTFDIRLYWAQNEKVTGIFILFSLKCYRFLFLQNFKKFV